jgi:hypothetical protein
MNAPYKNLRPSIYEKLDEIVADGRTRQAACTELKSMIRDRAVILFDPHNPAATDDWLREAAFTLIDAVRQNSLTTPLGFREYFEKVDVIDWAELDKAVAAAISAEEPAADIKRTQEEPATSSEPETAKRLPPKQGAALEAIKACFPDGVPDVTEIPNKPFCAQIFAWLKVHRPKIEMDSITILRAAGRAK